MPVQQYDSTAGGGRPTPQQPSIGCGLPGHTAVVYTGKRVCRYLYLVYRRMSPLASKKSHSSLLRFRATIEAGSLPAPTYGNTLSFYEACYHNAMQSPGGGGSVGTACKKYF